MMKTESSEKISPQDIKNPERRFFNSKNIFITLTYICNARCEKCITRYHKFCTRSMDKKLLDYLINEISKNDYQGVINLGSGESLTYEYLFYFVKSLLDKLPNVKFRILTNGKQLTDNIPDYMFDHRIVWGITLDGFYNKDLENLQYGIDIERVKENIKAIKQRNANLYLNYTLNEQSFHSLKDFLIFAKENTVKEVYITELRIFNDFNVKLKKYRFQIENHQDEMNELESFAKTLGLKDIRFPVIDEKSKFSNCYKKRKVYPLIDVDGSVSFCYGREEVVIGKILENDIYEKWNKIYTNLEQNELMGNKWCERCCDRKTDKIYFNVSTKVYSGLLNENR